MTHVIDGVHMCDTPQSNPQWADCDSVRSFLHGRPVAVREVNVAMGTALKLFWFKT